MTDTGIANIEGQSACPNCCRGLARSVSGKLLQLERQASLTARAQVAPPQHVDRRLRHAPAPLTPPLTNNSGFGFQGGRRKLVVAGQGADANPRVLQGVGGRKNVTNSAITRLLRALGLAAPVESKLTEEQDAALSERQRELDRYIARLQVEAARVVAGHEAGATSSEAARQLPAADPAAARLGYPPTWSLADVAAVMPEAYDSAMERYYVRSFGVTPEEAIRQVGIRRWRVAATLRSDLADLLAHVEGYVRHTQGDTLGVTMLDKFKFVDSLDPRGEGQPWGYLTRADPERGAPGYPRMFIENRAYYSRIFRLVHFEAAVLQNGMQILHWFMFPRKHFHVPLLSGDIVVQPGGDVSFAIVDATPLNADLSLPPLYDAALARVLERHGLQNNRELPEWASSIFSKHVLCLQGLGSGKGAEQFYACMKDVVKMHLMYCDRYAVAVEDPAEVERLREGQIRVCRAHKQNVRTQGVLKSVLGEELASEYMNKVMFCEEEA